MEENNQKQACLCGSGEYIVLACSGSCDLGLVTDIHGEVECLKVNYCLCNSTILKYKAMFDDFFGDDMLSIDINCEPNCK